MAYSRYHLSGVAPSIGEYLWTNNDEPILKVVDDTVKVHDMTFMSCFPKMYTKRGVEGHRSCAGNMAEAMAPYGMNGVLEVTDPFNVCLPTLPLCNHELSTLTMRLCFRFSRMCVP